MEDRIILTRFCSDCSYRYTVLREYMPGLIVGSFICLLLILESLAYHALNWLAYILVALGTMVMATACSPFCVTLWSCTVSYKTPQYEDL